MTRALLAFACIYASLAGGGDAHKDDGSLIMCISTATLSLLMPVVASFALIAASVNWAWEWKGYVLSAIAFATLISTLAQVQP